VVADRWLRKPERLDEGADARLCTRLPRNETQEPEPPWVGYRLERRREGVSVIPPQPGSQ